MTIGDSITQGYLRKEGEVEIFTNETWPMRLFGMINNKERYEVLNYGRSGKCA